MENDQAAGGDLIKVHYTYPDADTSASGESLWAVRLSKHFAKIDNIPFFVGDAFCLGDVVEIDDENEIVGVRTRSGLRTAWVEYSARGSPAQVKKRYLAIRAHLTRHGIQLEGIQPGFLVLAVPPEVTADRLEQICRSSSRRLRLRQ
jgi:hypothetical protein